MAWCENSERNRPSTPPLEPLEGGPPDLESGGFHQEKSGRPLTRFPRSFFAWPSAVSFSAAGANLPAAKSLNQKLLLQLSSPFYRKEFTTGLKPSYLLCPCFARS